MSRSRRETAGYPIRALITALTLLAFVVQSFAIQTHIHFAQPAAEYASQAGSPAKIGTSLDRDHHAPAPADDPAHCPLCQEFLHAGAYVTPAPVVFALPASIAMVTRLLIAPFAVTQSVSHDWRGRAPPLV